MKSTSNYISFRQHRFAELVVEGVPAGRAYEQAGYKAKGSSADVEASKALRKPKVAELVEKLRQEARDAAKISRDELVATLVEIIRSKPSEASLDNPLCEAKSARGEPYAVFPDKFRCMDKLIQILGYDHEAYKHHHSDEPIRVVIGGYV